MKHHVQTIHDIKCIMDQIVYRIHYIYISHVLRIKHIIHHIYHNNLLMMVTKKHAPFFQWGHVNFVGHNLDILPIIMAHWQRSIVAYVLFCFFPRKKVNCNSYITLSWFVQTMYFPTKNQLRLNSTSSPAAKPHSSMAYSPDRLTGVAWFKIQWLPYTYKINLYSTCRYVVKYIQECIYLMWICIYI